MEKTETHKKLIGELDKLITEIRPLAEKLGYHIGVILHNSIAMNSDEESLYRIVDDVKCIKEAWEREAGQK